MEGQSAGSASQFTDMRAEQILATLHEPLIVLDRDLRVTAANTAFYRTFLASASNTEGRLIYELDDGRWNIAPIRELLEKILPAGATVWNYRVEHDFPRIGSRTMSVNAHSFPGAQPAILLTFDDLTAQAAGDYSYHDLYHDNPAIYFSVDENGTIRSVNRFGADRLGYRTAELDGRSFFDLHREDIASATENFEKCLAKPGEVCHWDIRIECSNRVLLWVRESARVVVQKNGMRNVLIVCEDITEARKLMRKVSYYATHDSLTRLENRREFEQRLARVLQTIQEEHTENVLCYMDLDQFKIINDTCGHLAGDELLRRISEVLRGHVRTRDTVARLGGDEFGVLMEHCGLAQGERVAHACQEAVRDFRFRWDEKTFTIGVSIGVVAITPDFRHVADVLSGADSACYSAKLLGRNRVYVYRDNDCNLARRESEAQWVTTISDALQTDSLHLSYQPIVPLTGARRDETCYEILVRIDDRHGRETVAEKFLPTVERYDLARRLDRNVIDTALRWFDMHPEQVDRLHWCSINLSGQSLGDPDFLGFVLRRLCEGPVPAEKICFELTETAAISNIGSAIQFMSALKRQGCLFALDDFGSGFSSFAYLKTLPVDFLKIDGLFVRDIDRDPVDFAMVKSLNEIGHVMGKKTIAEFVERDSTLEKLRVLGVDYGQGNMLGKPQPLAAMLDRPGA